MERLQQDIENLKAEAAENGEEEVNSKCVKSLFSICVLKCCFMSFWLGHILVRIKRSVAISEEFSSPPLVKPQFRLINNEESPQYFSFFLLERMGQTHEYFCPFYFFLCSIREESLDVVLRAVHIYGINRSSSENICSGALFFFSFRWICLKDGSTSFQWLRTLHTLAAIWN